MPKAQEAVVVAHTHWDREWYLPFERFRGLLVELVDRVLQMIEAHPGFIFLLDGQTAVLDDYLDIRPERRADLQRYIANGRLIVGPWYTQPDEFLVSEEALVRNLLYGLRKAEEFGRAMHEGYVPDLFGHQAQLPQIFQGFDIKSAFLMRGVGEKPIKSEFWWESPDGSRVWTHRFPAEYGNAPSLRDPNRLAELTKQLGKVATTTTVLWMHGNDHTAPERDVMRRLKELSKKLNIDLRMGTLYDYRRRVMDKSPRLESVRGELREGRHAFLLSNVLSARVYLKQANDRVQALIERYAEPISSWNRWLGNSYPNSYLEAAWRLLMQNHAHDSIGGCSIDPVHREVEVRFARAKQIAEEVLNRQVKALSRHLDCSDDCILVYNPHPWPWRGRVETLVPVAGKEIPATVRDEQERVRPLYPGETILQSVNVLEGVRHLPFARVSFFAEVPPLGYRAYFLSSSGGEETDSQEGVRLERRGDGIRMENEFLEVYVAANGTLDLHDRRTGHQYSGLLALENEADRGDEYTFMPLEESPPLRSDKNAKIHLETAENNGDWATVLLRLEWELPEALTPDRKDRSPKKVLQPITVHITLQKNVPRLDVEVSLTNRIRDHRLRVRLPLPGGNRSVADTAFGLVERPPREFVATPPPGWREAPSSDHPLQRFVAVEDGERGLAVATQGLHEYSLDPTGVLRLTLVRSIEWLSRNDLSVRPGHAGPPYHTPEAQCLRPLSFAFSLIPYDAQGGRNGVRREALRFHAPARAWHLDDGPSEATEPLLPSSASWLKVEPEILMISTLKQSEDGRGLILRLYNPSSKHVKARVRFPLFEPETVHLASLDEKTYEPLNLHNSAVEFEAEPWRIITLRLGIDQ